MFLGPVFLLPVLVQRMGDFGQPRLVFDQFQQFQRGKKLHTVGRGIAQRLEQLARHQNPHIGRLAVQHHRDLFGQQPGRRLGKGR